MNTPPPASRLALGRVLVTRRLKASCVPSDILPCLYLHSRRGGTLKNSGTHATPFPRPFAATYETCAGAGISIFTDAEEGTTVVAIAAEVSPSPAGDLESWIISPL